MKKEQDLLDIYFRQREEEILDGGKIGNYSSTLKKVKAKEINDIIEKLPNEYQNTKNELKEKLQDLAIDYDIKLACYNKEYYRQGFYDAVFFNNQCK